MTSLEHVQRSLRINKAYTIMFPRIEDTVKAKTNV